MNPASFRAEPTGLADPPLDVIGEAEPETAAPQTAALQTETGPLTAPELTAWLIERVAVYLRRRPEEIDPDEPLAEYGLDSVAALSLCGDVEEDFDLILDPTAAWDYPTASAFAAHVERELAARDGRE